jgi:hypothetical protein
MIQNIKSTWSSLRKMVHAMRSACDSLARREVRELVAPISAEGIGLCAGENYATRPSPKGWREKIFTPSTVVLDGGWAEWRLQVPKYVRKQLIDMTLRIETIRTHGMLHSPRPGTRAWIYVNGDLVDEIKLVKPHPHGEDYGVDTRRPLPVLRYIDRGRDEQTIKVGVEAGTLWDIDRVALEPIILRREIRPGLMLIMGAIVSSGVGAIVRVFT